MATQREDGSGGGCALIVGIIFLIGLVIVVVTSIAALIDPFSWVPPIGKVFDSCTDNPDTAVDECAGSRHPGLWWHVIVNFVYALAALGLLLAFTGCVRDYRAARSDRFDSDGAVERYRRARQDLLVVAGLLAGLAAIPIIAALA
jgi:hypothetical protein